MNNDSRSKSSNKFSLRYPTTRREYARIVGKILVDMLARILHDLGFTVHINPLQANGVDMSIFYQGKLIAVLEIMNWGMSNNLDIKRFNSIVNNLSAFNCPKFVVISYRICLGDFEEELEKLGIKTIEIGFHLVPLEYYSWFKARNRHYDKKPLIPSVYEEIESRLSKLCLCISNTRLILGFNGGNKGKLRR